MDFSTAHFHARGCGHQSWVDSVIDDPVIFHRDAILDCGMVENLGSLRRRNGLSIRRVIRHSFGRDKYVISRREAEVGIPVHSAAPDAETAPRGKTRRWRQRRPSTMVL